MCRGWDEAVLQQTHVTELNNFSPDAWPNAILDAKSKEDVRVLLENACHAASRVLSQEGISHFSDACEALFKSFGPVAKRQRVGSM